MVEDESKTADELKTDPIEAEDRLVTDLGGEEEEPLTAADIFPCDDEEEGEICEPEP